MISLVVILLTSDSGASAQTNPPTVRGHRVTDPIHVDGKLDEPIYAATEAISGFVQQEPDEGKPATEKTEAWIFFDDKNIYVSARCYESHPERRVANEMRRDTAQLRQNDHFAVLFDTFHDKRNGYIFYANAIGGLSDGQITDEGPPNNDWNTVWDVKTGRFDGGWTIEMAIPFKSLRYQPGADQTWGSTSGGSSDGRTNGRTSPRCRARSLPSAASSRSRRRAPSKACRFPRAAATWN